MKRLLLAAGGFVAPALVCFLAVGASIHQQIADTEQRIESGQELLRKVRAAETRHHELVAEIEVRRSKLAELQAALPEGAAVGACLELVQSLGRGLDVSLEIEAVDPTDHDFSSSVPLRLRLVGSWQGLSQLLERLQQHRHSKEPLFSRAGAPITHVVDALSFEVSEQEPSVFAGVLRLEAVYFRSES